MQKRPYVICHMSPSIDGKIVSKNWPSLKITYAAYERTATTLAADAWIVGRVSMAPYAGKSRVRRLTRKRRQDQWVIPRRRLDRRAEHPDRPRRGWQHRHADILRRDGGEGVGAETPVDLDLEDQGRSGLAEIQDVNRRLRSP